MGVTWNRLIFEGRVSMQCSSVHFKQDNKTINGNNMFQSAVSSVTNTLTNAFVKEGIVQEGELVLV